MAEVPIIEDAIPDAVVAEALAHAAIGLRPIAIKRFTTGAQHYVFDVAFTDRDPVVVRISLARDRALALSASRLSHALRPLGVPLPAILAEGFELPFPHMILERLPGIDLGHVIAGLPKDRLDAIAAHVVRAQQIVAATPSANHYGYADTPAKAPHNHWSQVLAASLARSRTRIAAAGLFDPKLSDPLATALASLRTEADAQPATPFLHDTTVKNVIVTYDGDFSGIVDVDDLCFGDPRLVVGLTHAALLASGGPLAYTKSWMRGAAFRNDRLFRFYIALFLLDFIAEEGQVFNGNQQPSSPGKGRALLDLYAFALSDLG